MVSLLMLDVNIVQAKCNANQEDIATLIATLESRLPGSMDHVHGGEVTLSQLIKALGGSGNGSHYSSGANVHKRDLSFIARLLETSQDNTQAVDQVPNAEGGVLLRRLLATSSADDDSVIEVFTSFNNSANNYSGHGKNGHGDDHGDGHGHSLIETVAHALHITSIVILGIFLVEVILKCYALRLSYFRKKMELVDGIIIIISFTVDVIFYDGLGGRSGVDAASLLIFFLMWRMLRVFNGFLVTSRKRLKFRLTLQMRARKRAETKISDLDLRISFMEKELASLRQLATKYGAKDHEVLTCKPKATVHKNVTAKEGISSMLCASMSMMHHFTNKDNASKNESMSTITEDNSDVEDKNSNKINPFMFPSLKNNAPRDSGKDNKDTLTTVNEISKDSDSKCNSGNHVSKTSERDVSKTKPETKPNSEVTTPNGYLDKKSEVKNDSGVDSAKINNMDEKGPASITDKRMAPVTPEPSNEIQNGLTQDPIKGNNPAPTRRSTRSRGTLSKTAPVIETDKNASEDAEPAAGHLNGQVNGTGSEGDSDQSAGQQKYNDSVSEKKSPVFTNGDVISQRL